MSDDSKAMTADGEQFNAFAELVKWIGVRDAPVLDIDTARRSWLNAVMSLGPERTSTIRRMLVDVATVVDYGGPAARRLAAALAAFDESGEDAAVRYAARAIARRLLATLGTAEDEVAP